MSRTTNRLQSLAVAGAIAVTIAACTAANGGSSSPTPVPSRPPGTASPLPTEAPGPSGPVTTPSPSEEPIEVVRFAPGTIVRVTADGVPVRVSPDLDAELVDGYDQGSGEQVEGLELIAGDEVGIVWGPFYADGQTWYAVQHHDVRSITFTSGSWISAESLEQVGTAPTPPVLVAIDGLGTGGAATGEARAGAGLYVNVAVTPMPGDEGCQAEVTLIGTDGEATTLAGGEITETTILFSSPLENRATVQEQAGQFTLQVKTDCSWAAMAFEPQA